MRTKKKTGEGMGKRGKNWERNEKKKKKLGFEWERKGNTKIRMGKEKNTKKEMGKQIRKKLGKE